MAALPPRHTLQPRTSARERDTADGQVPLDASINSETVLLDSSRIPSKNVPSAKTTDTQTPTHPPVNGEEEPRKCWICFTDETEDGPDASAWRSPCPCALVAHENCLLDWVASQEAPNSRRQAGTGSKFNCPQCKNEIHLNRPTSRVVAGVRAVERITSSLILPGTVGVLGYAIHQACFMHGVSTVYALFGLEDGHRILQPLNYAPDALRRSAHGSVALDAVNRFMQNARLHCGVAVIPHILIASRVSIADSILPILPVLFLASSKVSDETLDLGHWPPSAALSFSLLPYIRGAYNSYMERVWGERQRRWLQEIQPRAGEADGEQRNAEHEAINLPGDDDAVFELNLRFIRDGEDEDEQADGDEHFHDDLHDVPGADRWPGDRPAERHAPLPDGAAPVADNAAPQPQQDDQQHQHQQPLPHPRAHNQRNHNIIYQTSSVADTVLGALVFPSIAAAMGELIRIGLPKHWATLPASGRPTGFLQQRWARSLLGGCLFVAVKDAVMVYVRWKMAENHRKRMVLDYDKKRGTVVGR